MSADLFSSPPLPRRALLTGVGRPEGIAAALAHGLAEDGWDLALSYHHGYDRRVFGTDADSGHARLVADLRARGRHVVLLPGDLSDPTEPEALVERASEALGGSLGALVLSHCESVDSSIRDTTVESFDRHYEVNVRASWLLLRGFAEHVAAARASAGVAPSEAGQGGVVLALTSDHTVCNLPYGATKAALDRLVLAAATELADLQIRANVINPGPIDTGWMDDAARTALAAQTPGGRLGGTGTVANLVRFLVSDRGAWINGQLLSSNGGFG